jgi:hypothetical protein
MPSSIDPNAFSRLSSIEFIDLSEEPAKAKIVRSGFEVPTVKLDLKRVDQFVGDLTQIPTKDLPRVISQAIPAGTKVAAGTTVDLVLAPRTRIPFDVFDGVHADLATKTLDVIDPLFANPAIKKTLLTYTSADEVPAVERAQLQTAFAGVGITVDETNPNRTFDKAFHSARGGIAFQG